MTKSICLLWLLLAAGSALGAQTPDAGLTASCAVCHGAEGQGSQVLAAPRLAGQDEQYLLRQLANFKAGRRGYAEDDIAGQRMRGVAVALDAEQIAQLAGHYAGVHSEPKPQTGKTVEPDAAARYQDTCAACHGQFAQGYPQQQAPNLRILDGWYIEQQLHAFVQGWRGAEGYSDIQGKWMRAVATQINDSGERSAVVGYIEALGAAPQ